MAIENIKKFLIEANENGYAAADERGFKREKDGSTTILYENGDWKMHDNYFGGEPYGGREVIFHKEKPEWMMVYYGSILDKNQKPAEVYEFLKLALTAAPDDMPVRGPDKFLKGDYLYANIWRGDLANFFGQENIYFKDTKIYSASYVGGVVDQ